MSLRLRRGKTEVRVKLRSNEVLEFALRTKLEPPFTDPRAKWAPIRR